MPLQMLAQRQQTPPFCSILSFVGSLFSCFAHQNFHARCQMIAIVKMLRGSARKGMILSCPGYLTRWGLVSPSRMTYRTLDRHLSLHGCQLLSQKQRTNRLSLLAPVTLIDPTMVWRALDSLLTNQLKTVNLMTMSLALTPHKITNSLLVLKFQMIKICSHCFSIRDGRCRLAREEPDTPLWNMVRINSRVHRCHPSDRTRN